MADQLPPQSEAISRATFDIGEAMTVFNAAFISASKATTARDFFTGLDRAERGALDIAARIKALKEAIWDEPIPPRS